MTRQNSTSRMLTELLTKGLQEKNNSQVIVRDLADGIPFIDQGWIEANFTDPTERNEAQSEALQVSDTLVNELRQADTLIMSVPIYNFGVPAAFKAWVDQIARARETFQYTEKGPEGLLNMSQVFLIVSSGGTQVGSDLDFVTGYIKLLFSFLGITDIEIIAADGLMTQGQEVVDKAIETVKSFC